MSNRCSTKNSTQISISLDRYSSATLVWTSANETRGPSSSRRLRRWKTWATMGELMLARTKRVMMRQTLMKATSSLVMAVAKIELKQSMVVLKSTISWISSLPSRERFQNGLLLAQMTSDKKSQIEGVSDRKPSFSPKSSTLRVQRTVLETSRARKSLLRSSSAILST